jgi:ferric-dicitrate binding protein FerR (iron transport regulator)
MKHPPEFQLALFAGGDLDLLERWRVQRHVSQCDYCRRELDSFRSGSETLRTEAVELPSGLEWDSLAAEMTANIHLGLEAGECVSAPATKPRRVTWPAAAVMAGMACMLVAAWWLNPAPRRQPHTMRAGRIEISSTASGIQLNENGNILTLLHTRGQQKPIIVSSPGTLRARFVDNETGQVTINNVFTE